MRFKIIQKVSELRDGFYIHFYWTFTNTVFVELLRLRGSPIRYKNTQHYRNNAPRRRFFSSADLQLNERWCIGMSMLHYDILDKSYKESVPNDGIVFLEDLGIGPFGGSHLVPFSHKVLHFLRSLSDEERKELLVKLNRQRERYKEAVEGDNYS